MFHGFETRIFPRSAPGKAAIAVPEVTSGILTQVCKHYGTGTSSQGVLQEQLKALCRMSQYLQGSAFVAEVAILPLTKPSWI